MFIKNSDQSEQPVSNGEMFDIANRLITALKRRDWELLRLLVTPDCIWRLPGNAMVSGVALGVDAIIKRASQTVMEGITLLNILYGSNGFALSLHNQETREELILDEYLTMTCILRKYKISAINTYLSSMESLDSFFHY